jgi:hypothetical protein
MKTPVVTLSEAKGLLHWVERCFGELHLVYFYYNNNLSFSGYLSSERSRDVKVTTATSICKSRR